MENQKEKFAITYQHFKRKLMSGAFLLVTTWIRCSVALNLTHPVSVIPQFVTTAVASRSMCLLAFTPFISRACQLMELASFVNPF